MEVQDLFLHYSVEKPHGYHPKVFSLHFAKSLSALGQISEGSQMALESLSSGIRQTAAKRLQSNSWG